ncbi:hypothetical protein GCM10010168_34740 [Actinoplanes ianthinogenes]|uniref:STAS domain-containing protein n=1 Tax=Actinoplanes ianthinogenes TaxID=122358 RepID=A0ABM7M5V0_9ACTN|nr:STAS domain-containing protein [Actinoplanes ianthinogenes]BCJ47006.1 hypothetical protein Aiant_76630 [Actinoplanes ianthinogenes]GGR13994.1 hypothetical protein GCM10010168_34740 [Actinoplanes ianthinogenes]
MVNADPPAARIRTHGPSARGVFCLIASGEFDRDNADLIQTAVCAALAAGRHTIVVDLGRVTFLDATTVNVLVRCQSLAAAHRGSLYVRNARPVVVRVLDGTGTHEMLTEAEAAASGPAELVATSRFLVDRAHTLRAETRRIIATIHADRRRSGRGRVAE